MAVRFQLAVQRRPVLTVDGVDVAFQPVPQIGDVRAPLEVAGQIAQRHAEAGEHHHRDRQNGAKERTVLKAKGKAQIITRQLVV